jgi:hypothetical protein
MSTDQDGVKAVLRILAASDPLPPWLSEAHYDDDYYELQAVHIVAELTKAQSVSEIRGTVDRAFEQTMPGMLAYARTTDNRLDERLDAIAFAIWMEFRI